MLFWYIDCALVYALVSTLVLQTQLVQYQSTWYQFNISIPFVCILPKPAKDPTSLVLGFECYNAYQYCTFTIVSFVNINLAMIMCFELCSVIKLRVEGNNNYQLWYDFFVLANALNFNVTIAQISSKPKLCKFF